MKIQLNRTDIWTWLATSLLILLLNTNFKTGVIRWDWVISITLSAFVIGQVQSFLIPRLMQKAINWTVQKTIGGYVVITAIVSIITSVVVMLIMQWREEKTYGIGSYISTSMIYMLMTFAFTSVYVIEQIINRWQTSLLKEQQLSQALLKAEYDTLKNQVNPHFLFNSLNILSALIPEDPQNAVNLVERLSKVFRYNLQNNEKVTVELSTEIKIVEAYLFIHKMRFGDNLSYELEEQAKATSRHIVTQGLLTLVENALKHNECSSEKPLHIVIKLTEEGVAVRNSFQPKNKQFLESTGLGLSNLKKRYELLTPLKLNISKNANFFEVTIPLI